VLGTGPLMTRHDSNIGRKSRRTTIRFPLLFALGSLSCGLFSAWAAWRIGHWLLPDWFFVWGGFAFSLFVVVLGLTVIYIVKQVRKLKTSPPPRGSEAEHEG
jgi:hypothetical protein